MDAPSDVEEETLVGHVGRSEASGLLLLVDDDMRRVFLCGKGCSQLEPGQLRIEGEA